MVLLVERSEVSGRELRFDLGAVAVAEAATQVSGNTTALRYPCSDASKEALGSMRSMCVFHLVLGDLAVLL